MIRFLAAWLYAVAVGADREASAITLGDPRETISSRLGKAGRGDYGRFWWIVTWPLRRIVNTVAWVCAGQADHCTWAIDDTLGSESPLEG
ncbi:MAG: hypothetical protein WCJ64_08425 [Rhodospirillaceae bacterium]